MSGERARLAFASAAGARCELSGRAVLNAEVHFEATEYEPIADVGRDEVGVQVLALAPRGSVRSKVRVRSVPSGPALVVEGYVPVEALPLRLLRKLDVLPGHVWFDEGALVQAIAGNGARVLVSSGERCTSGYGIAAYVDCSALAIQEPIPEPRGTKSPASRVESLIARRLPLALLDDERRRVFELGYGEIGVADREAPLTHVHVVQSGLNIRGWVKTSALQTPPDISAHCMEPRDVHARCPEGVEDTLPPEDSDGCRERDWEIREAVRDFPLRAGPANEARVVGRVERGARIRVPRSGTRFVSVDAEPRTLTARAGGPFWALASVVR